MRKHNPHTLDKRLLRGQILIQTHNNIYMKVKNDHRSKFSNLSSWKEET